MNLFTNMIISNLNTNNYISFIVIVNCYSHKFDYKILILQWYTNKTDNQIADPFVIVGDCFGTSSLEESLTTQ